MRFAHLGFAGLGMVIVIAHAHAQAPATRKRPRYCAAILQRVSRGGGAHCPLSQFGGAELYRRGIDPRHDGDGLKCLLPNPP